MRNLREVSAGLLEQQGLGKPANNRCVLADHKGKATDGDNYPQYPS